MKTYSTKQAAHRLGVSFRTLNRWLALGKIKPSQSVPYGGGRVLWRWTKADIVTAHRIKTSLKPGPKPKGRKP